MRDDRDLAALLSDCIPRGEDVELGFSSEDLTITRVRWRSQMRLAIPMLKVSRQITKMQPDHHTHWPKSAIARIHDWAEIDNSDGSSCL